jgi:cell wall assembly regulator SMI1
MRADTYVALLKSLHDEKEVAFRPHPGAREADLAAAERTIGFSIDEGLRELWRIGNGAPYETTFFGAFSDEETPCRFLSIEEAVEHWRGQSPLAAEQDIAHDERIAPGRGNARWLPFAEFNGFSTCVMIDRAPASGGRDGQIIVYQHDPDAMHVMAETFTDFLERSSQILRDEDFVE